MLRITVHDKPGSLTFKLEGSLEGPWVWELEACWQSTLASRRKPILRVDLTGVTFIDPAGQACLAAMHRQGAEFIAAAEYRSRHPHLRQLFPDLVQVGTCYNVWKLDGKYYGTLHWDDIFRPGLKDYAYLIEAGSLKEVLDEVPVRFEEFMEDLRVGYCIPPRLGTETIEEDYRGFTLTQAGCYCYATPADEGPFHINRFNARRYSVFFVADDEETLRRYVDEHAVNVAGARSAPSRSKP